MAGKTKRLSKVAREFNVGITTIVDFLAEQGHEIEASPNAKIEADIYEILQEEYADDQDLKEKSKKASIKREKRETITLKDAQKPESDEDDDEEELVIDTQKNTSAKEEVAGLTKDEKKEARTRVCHLRIDIPCC